MLQPLNDSNLTLILKWRNHPEVRKVMFTDREISLAEHLAWWEKVKADPSRRIYLFLYRSQPVGVVNFFDIDTEHRSCHWGFYLDNGRDWKPGERLDAWLLLEEEAIRTAFGPLRCDTLLCETFAFNEHVLALHRKFDFKEIELVEREKDGQPLKVIVMALKKKSSEKLGLEQVEKPQGKPLRAAFLGSANWDLIAQDFIRVYRDITGELAEVVPVPFGQYRTLLADAGSILRTANLDYCFFCERFEDLLNGPFTVFDATSPPMVESKLGDYLELIRAARVRMAGKFMVMDFAPVRPISAPLNGEGYEGHSEAGLLNMLNGRLVEFCATLPDCYVVSLSNLVKTFGARQANPGKYWHLGRIAFQKSFGQALNRRIAQTILALNGDTARVLVLDLDNTLWGGVIGDDGMSGIQLGGDYPGSVYVEIQETIKTFHNHGIVLAICSKNTESVAMEALRTHPGMRLRPNDFVITKINWEDKATNVKKIAKEIGVGLSSICVIDDSPYERDELRRLLPGIIVPDMPDDLTLWSSFLLDYPYLGSLRLTQEDRDRADRYRIRARIQKEAEGFGNKEDYWKSLDMRLYFHNFDGSNQQRVIQLLSKTNQFNMTTRRHNELDLRLIQQKGGVIVPVGLSDKYSERETIGVLVLQPSGEQSMTLTIDSFLLSCRVLGRSVETGVLGWICRYAKSKGFRFLEGWFYTTERNQPSSGVYRDHGFTDAGAGRWLLDLGLVEVALPEWFTITEELNQ